MIGRFELPVVNTVTTLRARISSWRQDGETIALVPTMGAIHGGHIGLVRAARQKADRVIVTLFINPTQFGENEDLDTYPCDVERDRSLLADESADLLFMPDVAEMYPPGDATRIHVDPVGSCLEGEFRPGFFIGVATVVTKLLIQSLPDYAMFGEKDFQQLHVIRRVVRDLYLPVEIVGHPTVREENGLALSSRNAYLSAEERRIAPELHRIICRVAKTVGEDGDIATALNTGRAALLSVGFKSVDYLTYRDSETFRDLAREDNPGATSGRILTAATLGRTRLIDNVPV